MYIKQCSLLHMPDFTAYHYHRNSAHRHWEYVNACEACVQLAHFSSGDWEDISIAHVIIIIKSEVSTLPIIIFFGGCVPEMSITSYSVTNCIYIPGKPGFCFHYYCADIRFGLQIVFVCLYITPSYYHHCANLSQDNALMRCLSDIFCRVC